jgi:hypothetical protein
VISTERPSIKRRLDIVVEVFFREQAGGIGFTLDKFFNGADVFSGRGEKGYKAQRGQQYSRRLFRA